MRRWLVIGAWCVGIVGLAAFYAYVATGIFRAGTFTPGTTYVIERAYAGLHSQSPFEELALVYPPIPIILYALLAPPPVATTVLAVIATALAVYTAVHYTKDPLTAVLGAVAMVTPAATTAAVEDATGWIFAAMLARALYLLARYTEREYSVYLFQAGLLIALGVFIDLRMAAFGLAVAAFLFVAYAGSEFWRGVSVALVVVFPVGYFFVAWTFVQWVFTGHWSILLPPLGIRPINEAFPAGIAYLVAVLFVGLSPRGGYRRYLVAACLAPLVVVLISSATGLTLGASDFALMGLACALVAITQVGNVWMRRAGALVLLASSIALSYTLPPLPAQTVHLAAPSQVIPVPVVTHAVWEQSVTDVRLATAVILAILTILLARHCLAKLTGRTA